MRLLALLYRIFDRVCLYTSRIPTSSEVFVVATGFDKKLYRSESIWYSLHSAVSEMDDALSMHREPADIFAELEISEDEERTVLDQFEAAQSAFGQLQTASQIVRIRTPLTAALPIPKTDFLRSLCSVFGPVTQLDSSDAQAEIKDTNE